MPGRTRVDRSISLLVLITALSFSPRPALADPRHTVFVTMDESQRGRSSRNAGRWKSNTPPALRRKLGEEA